MNADKFLSFIGTRLREEERLALAAAKEGHPDWEAYNRRPDPDPYPDWRLAGPDADGFGDRAASAQHAALHDPARVLRRVERDRLILAEHAPEWRTVEWPHDQNGKGEAQVCRRCQNAEYTEWHPEVGKAGDLPEGFVAPYVLAPCQTVRLLALPQDEHPDYRPEWRPA